MAETRKEGAKKIRVENGRCYVGNNFNSNSPRDPATGWPQMEYTLTVSEPWKEGGKQQAYTSALTEEEMLRTVTKWLEMHHRNTVERAKQTERAKGHKDAANG